MERNQNVPDEYAKIVGVWKLEYSKNYAQFMEELGRCCVSSPEVLFPQHYISPSIKKSFRKRLKC